MKVALIVSMSGFGFLSINALADAAKPICQQYWEARQSGQDWANAAPLSQYDDMCLTKLVLMKDPKGNCGVYAEAVNPHADPRDIWSALSVGARIFWFACQQQDKTYTVGDFVDGFVDNWCTIAATGHERCKYFYTVKSAETNP